MSIENVLTEPRSFEDKKRSFFTRVGLRVRKALLLHRDAGNLWEREKQSSERSWENVSEHCLVEVGRVNVLSSILALSPATARNLELAAAVHDFYKRDEITAVRENLKDGGSGREVSLASDVRGAAILKGAGFADEIIEMVASEGGNPETLFEIKKLLDKPELSEQEIARLAMHLVDDISQGSDWIQPSSNKNGRIQNVLDRRIAQNKANVNYTKKAEADTIVFAESPDNFFHNKEAFDIMGEIGHMVEERIAQLIKERSGEEISPMELPERIDNEIKKNIETYTQDVS